MENGMRITAAEHLTALVAQLTRDLAQNKAIRRFANNRDLIGAFAEASVRQLISRIVGRSAGPSPATPQPQ